MYIDLSYKRHLPTFFSFLSKIILNICINDGVLGKFYVQKLAKVTQGTHTHKKKHKEMKAKNNKWEF